MKNLFFITILVFSLYSQAHIQEIDQLITQVETQILVTEQSQKSFLQITPIQQHLKSKKSIDQYKKSTHNEDEEFKIRLIVKK